jgi:hypothetical protein
MTIVYKQLHWKSMLIYEDGLSLKPVLASQTNIEVYFLL